MFKVSVVIPNFNGEDLLKKNLPYVISAMKNLSNNIIEIIVVDDGSSDKSVKLLAEKFPDVRVIKHKINRGFSSSVNMGVRMSKGGLVVLLNTDVVPSENFLSPIFKHFEDEKLFAVSLHEKGFTYAKGSFEAGFIQIGMGEEVNKTHPSLYVSGGSGVFRRSLWMELGGMDEKLLSPFYWEDFDICYRAEKRGYKNIWEPKSIVEHHHESTISKLSKKYVQAVRERNQLLVIWKNIHSKSLIRNHVLGVARRLLRHPGYIRVVFMALRRLKIALRERKKEIKLSIVSDEAIFMRHG